MGHLKSLQWPQPSISLCRPEACEHVRWSCGMRPGGGKRWGETVEGLANV